MLEDPRADFAISQRGSQPGINHLGFQVESDAELQAMRGQLAAADTGLVEQTGAACCYALLGQVLGDGPGRGLGDLSYLDTIPMYGEDTHLCHAECVLYPAAAI